MSPRALPVLCFCLLVLACTAVHQEDAPAETPTPSGEETSRWRLVQSKVKELVQPLVTRTRERWQSFWSPGAFQGFVQTYYDDHLRNLGSRTQAWLRSSKDSLLSKAQGLCPRLLCRDQDGDKAD